MSLLHNPEQIVLISLNMAINHSSSEVIVRLDVHATYPSDYVESLVNYLVRHRSDGVKNVGTGITTRPGGEGLMAQSIAVVLSSKYGVGSSFRSDEGNGVPREVDTVPFGCWWRKDLISAGMFDEQMIRNQDDELNWRMCRNGGSIHLIPYSGVAYFSRPTLRLHSKMFFQYGFFKPLTMVKSKTIKSFRAFFPVALILFCFSCLVATVVFKNVLIIGALAIFLLVAYLGLSMLIISGNYDSQLVQAPYLLIVLMATHIAYGVGFLYGATSGVLFQRKRQINASR